MRLRATSKYHAQRTQVDGITFASKKEARRYQELKLLQQAGEISSLLLQPRYRIFVKPMIGPGELVNCGAYVGDFQYWQGTELIVEDVKGVRTPIYKLKKKIVEVLYGITIRET